MLKVFHTDFRKSLKLLNGNFFLTPTVYIIYLHFITLYYIYIYIYIYIKYLLHESDCDMVTYVMSRLIYFQEPKASEIKPESEISHHNTLISVISGLFHTRYLHYRS